MITHKKENDANIFNEIVMYSVYYSEFLMHELRGNEIFDLFISLVFQVIMH